MNIFLRIDECLFSGAPNGRPLGHIKPLRHTKETKMSPQRPTVQLRSRKRNQKRQQYNNNQ